MDPRGSDLSARLDQTRAPLSEAIRDFHGRAKALFCIPGHHMGKGAGESATDLLGREVYLSDLTESPGLDDLYRPSGAIREAQDLAAEAFGADETFFLVDGTTSGNQAMILSTVKPGERILVDPQAHRSVHHAIQLAGGVPVLLPEKRDSIWQIQRPVRPEEVQDALETDPAIRAVHITSPSYYGVCADIRGIADICHEREVLLLVDEAHGAHFSFSELLPESAMSAGADAAAQSTHKTLGSLGQSSMLHIRTARLHPETVRAALGRVMTSSPSYVLMASLDATRQEMALRGEEHMKEALDLAFFARARLAGLDAIDVLSPTSWSTRPSPEMDPLRLVLSAARAGIRGEVLGRRLFEEHGVVPELVDARNVCLVITHGNRREELLLLLDAIRSILQGEQGT